MKRALGVWCLGITLLLGPFGTDVSAGDDALWKMVLSEFVDGEGLVDYEGLTENPERLNTYVSELATRGPSVTPQLFTSRQDSFAFWLNAYNAFVLHGVTQSYPVKSVTDILPEFGFFKQKTFLIDGRKLTLDEIEHTILRSQFQDPRIHAAINCAAKSCPKLANRPFTATKLDSQLEAGMRHMIQSYNNFLFESSTQTLYLSRIFEWFEADFTNWLSTKKPQSSVGLVDYVAKFSTEEQRQLLNNSPKIKVLFREYDWYLNDQSKRR